MKRKYKHSIRRQITIAFALIMLFTIGVCLFMNDLFLEKFYILNKERALKTVYDSICSGVNENELDTDEFELEMQKYVAKHNVSICIITSLFEPVKIYSNEPSEELMLELRENIIRDSLWYGKLKKMLLETDEYVMGILTDKRTQTDYIEVFGTLPDGSLFMLRTALESIKDSATIASRFLLYVGIVSLIISTIAIFFLSKNVTKPILEIADISEKMAKMDFETTYKGENRTEIGLLGNNINILSNNLKETISELKTANIELSRDNEQKAQIDEVRKEFLSNVSHELKTPLALIQGYAEGLKEGINEEEERDYYCDVIIDEAGKMNTMVKKLLNLNQLEFGNNNVTMERFDIISLIKNYVQSAEIMIKQNDIKVNLPNYNEFYVWADEFMTEEAFSNYFSNAINHCEGDGQKRIDVNLQMIDNKVRVSVYNTGKPIPGDSIDHIWEKFYKVDKARTREYGGSGVGLSIVKAIMEAMGQQYGVINIDDGVEFWFTLDKV